MPVDAAGAVGAAGDGVIAVGITYRDILMNGLPALPRDGEEVYAARMEEGWGGIATMARVLARLRVPTYLSTAVGTDSLSEQFLSEMTEEKIDTSLTATHDSWSIPTTVALSTADDRAMATFESAPPLPPGHHITSLPEGIRAIITDLRDAPSEWLVAARTRGVKVYSSRGFDHSGQWSLAQVPGISQCDVWMLNDLEAEAFTGTRDPLSAARALSTHVPLVIVTCGKDGMVAVDRTTGEEASVGAFESRARNKTGAGDSTLAAFTFADRPGLSLEEKLLAAAFIVAAILDRDAGAANPLTLSEVQQLCTTSADPRAAAIAPVLCAASEVKVAKTQK